MYKINQKCSCWRSDIRGWTRGYITGFTKKRIKAFNHTLDRIGNYKPEHISIEESPKKLY